MTLIRGILIQLDVITALILRETRTRFGNTYLGYVWALIEPLLWVATFYFIFNFLGKATPWGTNILSYIATGMITFLTFRQVVMVCMNAIDANKALLFYPQVKPLDLMIARFLLEIGTIGSIFIIIVLCNGLFFGVWGVEDIAQIIAALLMVGIFAMGIGMAIGGLALYFDSIRRIVPPLIRVMFFTSGIFFSPSQIPYAMQSILMLNPVTHAIEMVRDGYFVGYKNSNFDPLYLATTAIISLGLGMTVLHLTKHKMELI